MRVAFPPERGNGYFFSAECERKWRQLSDAARSTTPTSRRWWAASRAGSGRCYSPTVIAAAITSQTGKARLPTHIEIPVDESCGLSKTSTVLLEQVRTLDKKRLRERMGRVDERLMEKIDLAIAVSFGLPHQRMV